jgi:hypothetical protein
MLVTFDRSRIARVAGGALLALLLCASASQAQLLDFPPPTHPSLLPAGSWTYALPYIEMTKRDVGGGDHPEWVQGKTTYDGTYLTIQAFPQWITFPNQPFWYQAVSVGQASDEPLSVAPCGVPTEGGIPLPIECGNFTTKVRVDSYTGAMVGGTSTDLVFRGHVILSHFACGDGVSVYPNCGTGGFGEVIDLDANGTLLTGKIVEMGSQYVDATTARFNFRVSVTGGLLAGAALGSNRLDSNAFDFGVDVTAANFTGSFAAGAFSGDAKGVGGGIQKVAGLGQCTGLVNGRVWNDINRNNLLDAGEAGLSGAAVTLTKTGLPPKSTTTDSNGIYAFPYVCGGDNQIDVAPPTGFLAGSSGSSRVVTVPIGGIVSGVNFAFFPVPTGNYETYIQAAWGAKPKNGNAAKLLFDKFNTVYPTGELVIGIPDTVGRYSITMTGADVIQTFLPQGGPVAALTKSYVDPLNLWKLKHKGKWGHHKMISQLAGQVMALQLNVDFSNFGITRFGLGTLKVVSGPLAGQTVNQVLALANRVLGGDPVPAGLTLQTINDVVFRINLNYLAGVVDTKYLQ